MSQLRMGWHSRTVGTPQGMPRWTGVVFIVIGLLFLLAMLRYQIRLAVLGTKATGEVVAFDRTARGRSLPRVRVMLQSGGSIEFCGTSLRGAPIAVGDVVPVYYLASNPTFGEIATFRRFWLGVIVISTIIAVSIGVGVQILVRRR